MKDSLKLADFPSMGPQQTHKYLFYKKSPVFLCLEALSGFLVQLYAYEKLKRLPPGHRVGWGMGVGETAYCTRVPRLGISWGVEAG